MGAAVQAARRVTVVRRVSVSMWGLILRTQNEGTEDRIKFLDRNKGVGLSLSGPEQTDDVYNRALSELAAKLTCCETST